MSYWDSPLLQVMDWERCSMVLSLLVVEPSSSDYWFTRSYQTFANILRYPNHPVGKYTNEVSQVSRHHPTNVVMFRRLYLEFQVNIFQIEMDTPQLLVKGGVILFYIDRYWTNKGREISVPFQPGKIVTHIDMNVSQGMVVVSQTLEDVFQSWGRYLR